MSKKPSLMAIKNKPQKKDTKIAKYQDSIDSPVATERSKQQIIRMYPDAHKALKLLAIEQDTSVNALLTEAINNLFEEHGKEPIA